MIAPAYTTTCKAATKSASRKRKNTAIRKSVITRDMALRTGCG